MSEENLIKSFIGKNSDVIYEKMNKKGSFNIYSMLFTSMYFLYRKMYLIGIISFILQYIIAEFVNNIFVSLACFVIWGFAFYPLYKIHVNRKVNNLTSKEFTEEDINKKGGTSIGAAIIVPVVLIIILLASIGIQIMNSAIESGNEQNANNSKVSNTTNYYSYNGSKIKYGSEWKEKDIELSGQRYKALGETDGDIVITCLQTGDIYDGITDYSLSSVREQLYNEWIYNDSTSYSAYGLSIIKQSNGFKELSKGLYYAYYEIYNDNYRRAYFVIDSTNNMVASLMAFSNESITETEQEEINDLLETIKF